MILKRSTSFSMIETNQKATDSTSTSTSNSRNHSPKSAISSEIERIQRRVDGFAWKESVIWTYLCWRFGPKLNQDELVSIGKLVAGTLGIELDRDARRRKCVMMKWFEEHWIEIEPLLWNITLEQVGSES
jgi:hypothetical protein